MSSTAKSRHFRLEDEYMEMLDSIQKREYTGGNNEITRTDVLKRVIKKEYLSSINATSGNALFECKRQINTVYKNISSLG